LRGVEGLRPTPQRGYGKHMLTHSRPTHQYSKLFIAAAMVGALALPASAFGQATRTWVSGVGDDANPCSRTAPCKTFAGAISKTAAKGEINVLDPGGFGGVTITKSITIDGEATEAGVLVSGTNAIVINAAATDTVALKGLDVNGLGTGLNGVRFLAGKRLRVQNTKIYGFVRNGIDFVPSTANAKLAAQNVRVHDNTGNGVFVNPQSSGGGAAATLRNVTAEDNGCGLTVTAFGADPAFNFTANCGARPGGVQNTAATAAAFRSAFNDNAGFGVFARGGSAVARISDNDITGNFFGLIVLDGGQILSWKNNFNDGNTNNGGATGTLTPAKRAHKKLRGAK
jgi:hypothetical protein